MRGWMILIQLLLLSISIHVVVARTELLCSTFIGLAYQGNDIVFRFIVEYSSLRDFGP
jgi:hypothetical protein